MSFKGFCVYTVERNLSISNIASSSRIKVGKSNRFYIQTNLALTVGTRFVWLSLAPELATDGHWLGQVGHPNAEHQVDELCRMCNLR